MKALLFALLLLVPITALAQPDPPAPVITEKFDNPQLEARARNLQRQLRCLVCQGESIDESRAPLAADLRHLARQQIAAGKTDQQIQDYLVARFGIFVLMKPPLESDTWLLWLAPFLVLGTGAGVAWMTIRKASGKELAE